MAGRKKLTREELKEKLEPMGEAVVKASQTVTEMAREAAEKAAPRVKAAAKRAEPTVRAAEKTLKDTGKKAAAATKKAASALTPEMYLQWGGSEVSCADLTERVRTDFKAAHKGAIRSCRIYVKPEEGMVYYVINGKEGKLPL